MSEAVETPVSDPRAEAIALVKQASAEAEPASEPASESTTEADTSEAGPAVEEPAPKPDRVAGRIAAAKRAELRAASERQRITAERAELEKLRAELTAKEARYRKLDEDPVAAFEELKINPKDFLEKLAGTQNPLAKDVATLRAELAKEREERERFIAETQRREQKFAVDSQVREASQQFIEHVAASTEKYPHLVEEFTPEEIVHRGLQVADAHGEAYKREFGSYPSDEVIAQYLEDEAAERARRKSAWRERLGKRAENPSQGAPGDASNGHSVKAGTPRTLTSKAASQKATAPKAWSEKDAHEEAVRIVRKMHEAEAG